MHASPAFVFFEQFKLAAGEGALVELKLRLLADKIPQLQHFAHAQKLEDIEVQIASHFGATLSEEDRSTLATCRQLRNKVLHCSFGAARGKLRELGVSAAAEGAVVSVSLHGLSFSEQIARIESAVAGGALEASTPVAATSATAPGAVFGWLLELGNAGDFTAAAQAFREAAAIVDRLAAGERGKA